MRVRATRDFRTYYEMKSHRVAEGQEFDGAFAAFLANGRAPVEVLDDEAGEPDEAGGLDINGTAEQVMAWAGDDPDRARVAIDAETAKDKPRSTLLAALRKIG